VIELPPPKARIKLADRPEYQLARQQETLAAFEARRDALAQQARALSAAIAPVRAAGDLRLRCSDRHS